jgi:hypothetical protein
VSVAEAVTPGQVDWASLIPVHLHREMRIALVVYCKTHRMGEKPWLRDNKDDRWKQWSAKNFFTRIMLVYPLYSVERDTIMTQLKSTELVYSAKNNFQSVTEWFRRLNEIMGGYDLDGVDGKEVVDVCFRKLRTQCQGAHQLYSNLKKKNSQDFDDLWTAWETERRKIGLAQSLISHYEPGPDNQHVYKDSDDDGAKGSRKERRERAKAEKKRAKKKRKLNPSDHDRGGDRSTSSTVCKVCGKGHSGSRRLYNHPDSNHTDKAWADSDMGKRWKAKGFDSLDGTRKLNNDPWKNGSSKQKTPFKQGGRKHGKSWAKAKYEYMYAMQYVDDNEYTLPCQIHNEYVTSPLSIRVLIDTGALQSNYINLQTAARLQKARAEREMESRRKERMEESSCTSAETCSCLDVKGSSAGSACCDACVTNNDCSNSNDLVSPVVSFASLVQNNNTKRLNLKTRNKTKTGKSITALRRTCLRQKLEKTNNNKSTTVCSGITGMCTESPGEISFNFTYFDSATNKEETIPITAKILDTPYDLILGRPDIKKHNLLQRIGNHLFVESNSSEPLRARQTSLKEHTQFRDSNGGTDGSSMLSMLYKKEDLLSPEYDDDGLEGNDPPLPWDSEEIAAQHPDHAVPSDEAYKLPEVAGSEQFQAKIRELLKEYKHVFSEELRKEPAKLKPFDVKFDREKWQRPRNSLPPRPQSRNKHAEIRRQIDKMLAAGVIAPSQAPWYSQVHLTPKPNDKWRFCIDFRTLNDCSESMGWPIPNVYRMLQRLGNKRAKY